MEYDPETLFRTCLKIAYRETPRGGHYAVARRGSTAVLYFQHSVGWEDWRHNLNFPIARHGTGEDAFFCHRGFLRVWRGMEEEIFATVSRLKRWGSCRILCVGYSHGAALALLAVICLRAALPLCRVEGIGFGTPRVLWGRVPPSVGERASRFLAVRNPPDLVTHLPPRLFGYRTPQPMLTLPKKSKNPFFAHTPEGYLAALPEMLTIRE